MTLTDVGGTHSQRHIVPAYAFIRSWSRHFQIVSNLHVLYVLSLRATHFYLPAGGDHRGPQGIGRY